MASSNVTTVSELEKKDTDKIDGNDKPPQAVGNTTNSEPKQTSVDGGVDNGTRNVDKAVPKWFKLGMLCIFCFVKKKGSQDQTSLQD